LSPRRRRFPNWQGSWCTRLLTKASDHDENHEDIEAQNKEQIGSTWSVPGLPRVTDALKAEAAVIAGSPGRAVALSKSRDTHGKA
jgi:hypothetical protein